MNGEKRTLFVVCFLFDEFRLRLVRQLRSDLFIFFLASNDDGRRFNIVGSHDCTSTPRLTGLWAGSVANLRTLVRLGDLGDLGDRLVV